MKYTGWETISNKYNSFNQLDLIIVLAGGLTERGNLHPWVIRRLDRSIELHRTHSSPILCLGGGTYHKAPYTNEKGFVVHESTECVNYLVQQGVDKKNIYREWASYDTIANAFFSLTTHVSVQPQFQNIGIVTSEFHIQRSKEIFDWVYNLTEKKYILNYFPVTDFGLDAAMLECRRDREARSLENVINLKKKIKTMAGFHSWLYTDHNAYNNNFILPDEICDDCKGSY